MTTRIVLAVLVLLALCLGLWCLDWASGGVVAGCEAGGRGGVKMDTDLIGDCLTELQIHLRAMRRQCVTPSMLEKISRDEERLQLARMELAKIRAALKRLKEVTL